MLEELLVLFIALMFFIIIQYAIRSEDEVKQIID
jgi:hypothetical protein